MVKQCDVPINIEDDRKEYLEYQKNKEAFKSAHILFPSRRSSVSSDVFIALWDMMETIVNGTNWQKKTRIVLEYDPQERKMEFTAYQSSEEEQVPKAP